MYKLLLVSDQEEVLNAFGQIQNWERQGFKPPHIRYDYDGMLDSLSKHHADGITFVRIPAYDSPCFVAERCAVELDRGEISP